MKRIPLLAFVAMTALSGARAPAQTCPSSRAHVAAGHHTVVTQVATHAASPAATKMPTIVEAAAGNKDFSTLVAAVKAAGLVEALSGKGPFTVFAPTDAAFAKLPKGTVETLLKPENKKQLAAILTYHVVAGNVPASEAVKLTEAATLQGSKLALKVVQNALTVGGAKVVKADIKCANGVIHVIDGVLLPPADEPQQAAADAPGDIVDVAAGVEDFSTLVAAVKAAGLVETLKGEGPFTVFAPTNEAFEKLPAGTLESLLKPENKEKLIADMTYHVFPGKVPASEAVKLKEAKTVQGQKLSLKATDAGLMIDGAKVIKPDVPASNGVIHVIDAVILPK